jgi:DNA-binding transcriptional MerR regulator
MAFKIGTLARRTGTSAPTIRYYEEIRRLPRPDRRESGQRAYGDDATEGVIFIRRCRQFGFSIEQVRTLLTLMQDGKRSCVEARDLAALHLASVRARLEELKKLGKSIARLVKRCESCCIGGPAPDCSVLEDLATPAVSSYTGSVFRGRKVGVMNDRASTACHQIELEAANAELPMLPTTT